MSNIERATFWIMGGLAFLAFSPLDNPGGKIVAGLGAMICSITGIALLLREIRK